MSTKHIKYLYGRTVLAGVRHAGALSLALATARYVGARSAATARSLFSATAMSPRSRAFLNVRPLADLMSADSVLETPSLSQTFPLSYNTQTREAVSSTRRRKRSGKRGSAHFGLRTVALHDSARGHAAKPASI